jgi:hypothetical protein
MRRGRRNALIGVIVGALLIATFLFARYLPYQVLRGNFDKVQVGMTLEEVQAILGPGQRWKTSSALLDANGKTIETHYSYDWDLPYYLTPFSKPAVHYVSGVRVEFVNDRATAKYFGEPESRDWFNTLFHW